MSTVQFSLRYRTLLEACMTSGIFEVNNRTGVEVAIANGPQHFSIDLGHSQNNLPIAGNRTIWPHIAAAEVAWQFLGTKNPDFIVQHAPKLWNKFIEDGEIQTAYGFRWRHQFGRDQIDLALSALKNDPTNRQVFISAWDPSSDGLGQPDQPKNIPCPVGFALNVSNGRLNMAVIIRSSDVYVGLPYDTLVYSLMLDAFAVSLRCKRGLISFTLAHAHIYQPHFQDANEELSRPVWVYHAPDLPYPGFSVEDIVEAPEVYVAEIKQHKIDNFRNTKPEVIE